MAGYGGCLLVAVRDCPIRGPLLVDHSDIRWGVKNSMPDPAFLFTEASDWRRILPLSRCVLAGTASLAGRKKWVERQRC